MNAELIKQNITQIERLKILREMAYDQINSLSTSKAAERLSSNKTSIEQK